MLHYKSGLGTLIWGVTCLVDLKYISYEIEEYLRHLHKKKWNQLLDLPWPSCPNKYNMKQTLQSIISTRSQIFNISFLVLFLFMFLLKKTHWPGNLFLSRRFLSVWKCFPMTQWAQAKSKVLKHKNLLMVICIMLLMISDGESITADG